MKKLLSYLLLSLIVVVLLMMVVSAGAQTTRIKLVQLEKATTVNGTKANQVPVSNTLGDLRYAQFPEINPVAIGYTPSATGNPVANYSQFVSPSNGDVWYIDGEGRGKRLYVAAASGDYDWLEIANNQIPNAITDSIYKYKYASIGGRYVWPQAEFTTIDSSNTGLIVISGNRLARVAYYDNVNQTWAATSFGGDAMSTLFPAGGSYSVSSYNGGTPQSPGTPITDHFVINGDSSLRFPQYKSTRTDPGTPTVLFGPDVTGKMKNYAVSTISGGSGSLGTGYSNYIQKIGLPSNRTDAGSAVFLGGDTIMLMVSQYPSGTSDFSEVYIKRFFSYNRGRSWDTIAPAIIFNNTQPGLTGQIHGVAIPSLLVSGDTIHCMFWGGKHYPGDGGPGIPYYDADILYSRSLNKGVTWSTPIRANANDTLYHAPGGDRLIRLKSGRLIYPTAVTVNGDPSSNAGNYTPYMLYSDNNGSTWTQLNTGVTSPSLLAVEPGVYQRKDDTLTMYFRTRDNWVYASNSTNNGLTWGSAYNLNLQSGNTLSTVKYIKQIDALVAAYNPLGFNTTTGLPVTSNQDVRQNIALTTSINNGISWGNNRFIFRGWTDSLISIEPNFLYDPILRNLHVFHSPSGNSVLNYAYKQDIVKLYDVLNLTSRSMLYANAKRIGINQKSNLAAPSDLLEIELNAQGGGNPGTNSDYGIFLSNKTTNNALAFGNALSAGGWLGELQMKALTGKSRINSICNSVSTSIPALEVVLSKNGGLSSLSATDIGLRVSTGVTTLSTVFGNGDYTILGNFSCALLSNPKVFDVLRLRQGAGLRLNATIGTDAATDGGLFQSAGVITIGDYATGTKSITVNTSTGVVSMAGKVGVGATTTPTVGLQMFSTDAFKMSSGTTAQRPTATAGYIRHNTDLNQFEGSGTGNTYYSFPQTLLSATSNTAFTNTTAVSTLTSVSIPANSLSAGQTLRIMVEGYILTDATIPGNFRVGIVYGNDTIYSAVGGLRPISGGAAKTFTAAFTVRISAAGASGTMRAQGFAQQQTAAADPVFFGGWYPFSNPTLSDNTGINTTTTKILALFGQFSSALATNGIVITNQAILRQ